MFKELKNGLIVEIKQPEPSDCESLVEMMKKSYEQSPFLTRYPDEFNITVEDEIRWISRFDHQKNTMLIVKDGAKVIANASIKMVMDTSKTRHRCIFGIAILENYHRLGLGRILINEMIDFAKAANYSQIELEVCAKNYGAIQLYMTSGFKVYGTRPKSFKMRDGSYQDEYLMVYEIEK